MNADFHRWKETWRGTKRHHAMPKLFGNQRPNPNEVQQEENYYVGKQQSVQWIRGAEHRAREDILRSNAGIKDL